ncbi:MAG: ectoine/hydroxyectoine ABC transporter ATP-binding protein EhuA [Devosia sp. 67-54]|uniref:amino acid ABC transporter ATP-binding protein n=1 Tax=unclassified Devosia TaxID=196773 RepID=UPI000969C77B|nr:MULTISPECIES: amino acid ABC transporter ATP-binding protein [unclassified Devosia]MBN9305485.1 amino acid ABC transporter ATP-binding protein [Devosia sp.]OJX19072.1 MAG: ectoine/hydroxyectoine ABC transporter ATP-binding protein EhuA [Devosia sp. 67-54]
MTALAAASTPILEAIDVRKSFGKLDVLKGISVSLNKGDSLCIMGPSGGGKSTFLRSINCLEMIDSGVMKVCGEEMGYRMAAGTRRRLGEAAVARQRRKTGMVFQQFNLFLTMNALDNVASGLVHVYGVKKEQAREQAYEQLKLVGIADKAKAYPIQLSGGQQQRVAIARALAVKPELMLFDEPTSALDPEMVQEVLDVIYSLRDSGMTMVIVTHEVGFAKKAADEVLLIADGVVAERTSPQNFFENPQSERTRQFLSRVLH